MLKNLLKEPLLHFAVLALVIFAAFHFLTPQTQVRPAASIVVTDLIKERGLNQPHGCRMLDAAGMQAVELTAGLIAGMVDDLLGKGGR